MSMTLSRYKKKRIANRIALVIAIILLVPGFFSGCRSTHKTHITRHPVYIEPEGMDDYRYEYMVYSKIIFSDSYVEEIDKISIETSNTLMYQYPIGKCLIKGIAFASFFFVAVFFSICRIILLLKWIATWFKDSVRSRKSNAICH